MVQSLDKGHTLVFALVIKRSYCGFKVSSKICTQCLLSDPLVEELTVEAFAAPIYSIEIHLLRLKLIMAQDNPREERANQFEGLNDVPLFAGNLEDDPDLDALIEDIDDPANLMPPTFGVSITTSAPVGVDVGPSELAVIINAGWLTYKVYMSEESIEACIKGIQQKYTSTLPYLISLDLSSNKIIGEIPDVLMDLVALTNLNLSRNELSGHIPTMIGNLKSMESLDLSMNKLSSQIPQSLASVNTLGYLNLSFNKLSGPLPVGNHFQTFDNPAIYEGNNGLCGFPLLSCQGNNLSYSHVGDDEGENGSQAFSWFYAGMVPGFIVGSMGLIISLHYNRNWRVTYFEMIENVYVFLMVSIK
uniref:receptor-like protein EIX2 n=1 Tax=Erigeron canadensis TaxID=72917 RepID=UPI001CB97598|nr:receptor-like protein EIX2 [Erigeron canadensis]